MNCRESGAFRTGWWSEGDSNPRCHETFDLARRCPKLALFLPQPTTIMSAENIVAFRSLTIFGS
jgi:hypothetical protein